MEIKANWIWRKGALKPCYNDVIIARREFDVTLEFNRAVVSITADSYYRLFVNNVWVCDGPARGWPSHYYYDQPDITDYLHNGANEIKIISCFYGTGHFHGIPQQPGLLAQLDIYYADNTSERIITDSRWQVAWSSGWNCNTPKISCQIAPAEYYNAGNDENLTYDNAEIICKTHEGLWQKLQPREVKMLTKETIGFNSFVETNILKTCDNSKTYCLLWAKLLYPDLIQANRRLMQAFALAVVIDAKTDIKFTVDLVDYRKGNYAVCIDGKEAEKETPLKTGHHLLFIYCRLSFNHATDLTICISADKTFELVNPHDSASANPWSLLEYKEFKCAADDIVWQQHSDKFKNCMEGYLKLAQQHSVMSDISNFIRSTAACVLQLSLEQMFGKDNYHRFINRKILSNAGSCVLNPENILSHHSGTTTVLPSDMGDVELVYDLDAQNIGYYSFELEAQQGVEVDIYEVEYILPDGRVQFPDDHRNGMTYITKAGVNIFTSLKRRSGRYVFIRFVNQKSPIKIIKLNLIESTYPVEYLGSFKCSDESLNKIWDISAHSLKLCMEDTFTDCPLYEQTLWVGDARNESLFAYGVFGSTDIAKRCISLAAESLESMPLIGSQVPSSWRCVLPAWSFLWGISVWDYYWYTNDKSFIVEMWPYIVKNLRNAVCYINEQGLFSGDFWNFFDWADIDQEHKTVLHNSMFMIGAVDAAVKCGQMLEKNDAELNWLKEFDVKLKGSINNFWQKDKKSYPDSVHEDGKISSKICQHTGFLSLLYDIAEPETIKDLLNNVVSPSADMVKVGSPFAIFYMYQMLEKYGYYDFIINSISENYLPMLDCGATTVWESFPSGTLGREEFPTRSHCHGWSSAPLYFFSRVILGIRAVSPGCESFEISPFFASNLDWAEGSFTTPRGRIEVSWRRNAAGRTEVSYKAPAGVKVTLMKQQGITCGYS